MNKACGIQHMIRLTIHWSAFRVLLINCSEQWPFALFDRFVCMLINAGQSPVLRIATLTGTTFPASKRRRQCVNHVVLLRVRIPRLRYFNRFRCEFWRGGSAWGTTVKTTAYSAWITLWDASLESAFVFGFRVIRLIHCIDILLAQAIRRFVFSAILLFCRFLLHFVQMLMMMTMWFWSIVIVFSIVITNDNVIVRLQGITGLRQYREIRWTFTANIRLTVLLIITIMVRVTSGASARTIGILFQARWKVILSSQHNVLVEETFFADSIRENATRSPGRCILIFGWTRCFDNGKHSRRYRAIGTVNVFRRLWFVARIQWSIVPTNCQIHRTDFLLVVYCRLWSQIIHRLMQWLRNDATRFRTKYFQFGAVRRSGIVRFHTDSCVDNRGIGSTTKRVKHEKNWDSTHL